MGGAVALEMALQRPQQVSRLVTINSLPSYRVDHWRKWLELNLQIGLVKTLGLRRTARMVGRRLFPEPHQAAMRQRVIDVLGTNQVEPYLRCARALAAWCAAERVESLRPPLLMIAGELDYTGTHVAVAVNHNVVPRARWAETVLRSGDAVEIITPRQGG